MTNDHAPTAERPSADQSPRTMPLRLHLFALVLVVLLPALAAGAVAAWDALRSHRRAFENGLVATAQALALAMDSELRAVEAMLAALAAANELEPGGDLAGFHARRSITAREAGMAVVLVGPPPDYRRLFDTRRPFGTALAAGLQTDQAVRPLERVAQSGRTEIFGVRRDPYGGWATGVMLPVRREDRLIGILVGLLDPAHLGRLLQNSGLTPGGIAALIDAEGRTVARSRDHDRHVGAAIPAAALDDHLAGRGTRVRIAPGQDGVPRVIAAAPLRVAPGWRLAVLEPVAAYDAAWRRPLIILVLSAAAALGVGAMAAYALSRRLVVPVEALAAHAEAVGRGEGGTSAPPMDPSPGSSATPAAASPLRIADLAPAGAGSGIARIPDAGVREYATLRDALVQSARLVAQRSEAARVAAIEARAQRRLLETVIEALPDAIFVKDAAGRYLLLNRAALGMLGVTLDEARGREHGFALVPADRARMVARHDRVRATGEAERSEDQRTLPDGQLHHFETLTVRWSLPDGGAPGGTIGVSRDVTDRRRMEAQLLRAESMLTDLVRRATVSALTSGLSHELNQPLSAATNYIGAARQLLTAPDDAVAPGRREAMAAQALDGATAQVRRAGDIIRRLRDYMRGQPLAKQPEDVAAVVREAAQLVRGALPWARDIPVRCDLPDGLPLAPMDRVQVQQVLLNLMRNALEVLQAPLAGRQPQVVLGARILPPDASRQAWLELSVTDNGPGLPPEVAEGGFEPLRTGKPDGMGLGLAICKDIASAHGGELRAEVPTDGPGTRMVLALPLPHAADPLSGQASGGRPAEE